MARKWEFPTWDSQKSLHRSWLKKTRYISCGALIVQTNSLFFAILRKNFFPLKKQIKMNKVIYLSFRICCHLILHQFPFSCWYRCWSSWLLLWCWPIVLLSHNSDLADVSFVTSSDFIDLTLLNFFSCFTNSRSFWNWCWIRNWSSWFRWCLS